MMIAGEEVRNPQAYLSGIARNVLRECWDSSEMRFEELDEDPPKSRSPVGRAERDDEERADLERRLGCLERCAGQLPEAERRRVIDYYGEEKRAKIDRRKRMAEVMGISQTALRVRMHRTREKLEDCISKCLADQPDDEKHF